MLRQFRRSVRIGLLIASGIVGSIYLGTSDLHARSPDTELLHLVQGRQASQGTRIASDRLVESWASRDAILGRTEGRNEAALYRSDNGAIHELVAGAYAYGSRMHMFTYAYSLLLRENGSVISSLRAETLAVGDMSTRMAQATQRVDASVAERMIPEARYLAIALVACGRLIVFGTIEESNRCDQKRANIHASYEAIIKSGRTDVRPEELVKLGWKVVGIGPAGAAFNVSIFSPKVCNPPFTASQPRLSAEDIARRYIRDYVSPRIDAAIRALPLDGRAQAVTEVQQYLPRLIQAIHDYESVVVTSEKIERFLEGEPSHTQALLPYFRRCAEQLRAFRLEDGVQLAARAYQAMQEAGGMSGGSYDPNKEDTIQRWIYGMEFPLTDAQRALLTAEQRNNRTFTWLDHLTDTGVPIGVKIPWYVALRGEIIANATRR